jgi:hypothetical protein
MLKALHVLVAVGLAGGAWATPSLAQEVIELVCEGSVVIDQSGIWGVGSALQPHAVRIEGKARSQPSMTSPLRTKRHRIAIGTYPAIGLARAKDDAMCSDRPCQPPPFAR